MGYQFAHQIATPKCQLTLSGEHDHALELGQPKAQPYILSVSFLGHSSTT